MDFRLEIRVVRWKCLPSASKMAGKPMAQRNARFREASRLMLAIALLAPSYASEQHECTLDAATCMVSCTACAECTTPSFLYDLGAYATPARGWSEVDGATTPPAWGNASSGVAAQFYYAACPSAATGRWLDPEQIRCGPAPPAPPPHQPHAEGDHPDHHYHGPSRWVAVVAEPPANGSAACASSPCALASSECAYLGRAEERTCVAHGASGLTCHYGGGGVSNGVAHSLEFRFRCAAAQGEATARQAEGLARTLALALTQPLSPTEALARSLALAPSLAPALTLPSPQAEGLDFVIELPGPAGCGIPAYPPSPSPSPTPPSTEAAQGPSRGSLFCVALLVMVAAYLCGGVAYNHQVHGVPLSLEAVPHIARWRQLAGLVVDGCHLAHAQCTRANEAVRDRNADPALTRSLARSGGDAEAGDEMAAVR